MTYVILVWFVILPGVTNLDVNILHESSFNNKILVQDGHNYYFRRPRASFKSISWSCSSAIISLNVSERANSPTLHILEITITRRHITRKSWIKSPTKFLNMACIFQQYLKVAFFYHQLFSYRSLLFHHLCSRYCMYFQKTSISFWRCCTCICDL